MTSPWGALAYLVASFGIKEFLWFLAGVGLSMGWHRVKTAYRNWRYGTNQRAPRWGVRGTQVFAVGIIVVGSIFVAGQTQQTHDLMINCQQQFNRALEIRQRLTDADHLLVEHVTAAQNAWISALLNPPANVNMGVFDDVRESYVQNNNERYAAALQQAAKTREGNDNERAAHPLPMPDCGH